MPLGLEKQARSYFVRYAILLFAIFAGFRLILEYFAGPFPLGNDSVNLYEIWLRTGQPISLYNLTSQAILYAINDILRNPSTSVKVVMVALQGSLSVATYYWLYSITRESKISFFATIATCFYFPVLRIEWDLLRNTLALIFGLIALGLLAENSKIKFIVANALLVFSVFSDIIIFPVIFLVILFSKNIGTKRFIPILISSIFVLVTAVFSVHFILSDVGGSQYQLLGLRAPVFVFYLLLPVLPTLMILYYQGSLKMNRNLLIWTIACLLATPFILGYRFAFLACVGLIPYLAIMLLTSHKTLHFRVLTIIILLLGVSYAVFPSQSPFPYYNINQQYSYLLPSSLMSNSLPIQENHEVTQLLSSNIELFNCHSQIAATSNFYDFELSVGIPTCAIIDLGNVGTVNQALSAIVELGKNFNGTEKLYVIWFIPSQSSSPNFWRTYSLLDSNGAIGLFVLSGTN